MSQTTDFDQTQAFDVGSVIAESFSILLRKLPQVILLGFIPSIIGLIFSVFLIGPEMTFGGTADLTDLQSINWSLYSLSMFLQMVIYGITVALFVQMAYDAKLGRPMNLGAYFKTAVRNIVPLMILTIVVSFVAAIAMLFIILPGLWVYAVWSVVVPAIVIERAGFGALGRSAQLTKGYRWPIIGLIVTLGICVFLISIGVMFVIGLLTALTGGVQGFGVIIAIVLQGLASAAVYGVLYIAVALIYARLREIKEGISVDQLVTVFE